MQATVTPLATVLPHAHAGRACTFEVHLLNPGKQPVDALKAALAGKRKRALIDMAIEPDLALEVVRVYLDHRQPLGARAHGAVQGLGAGRGGRPSAL